MLAFIRYFIALHFFVCAISPHIFAMPAAIYLIAQKPGSNRQFNMMNSEPQGKICTSSCGLHPPYTPTTAIETASPLPPSASLKWLPTSYCTGCESSLIVFGQQWSSMAQRKKIFQALDAYTMLVSIIEIEIIKRHNRNLYVQDRWYPAAVSFWQITEMSSGTVSVGKVVCCCLCMLCWSATEGNLSDCFAVCENSGGRLYLLWMIAFPDWCAPFEGLLQYVCESFPCLL